MKLLPKSLVGRTLLVLLVGLTVSHFIGIAIYSGERYLALTTQQGRNVAERIATAVRAFEEAEPAGRRSLARTLWAPDFSLVWDPDSAIPVGDTGWRAGLIRTAIAAAVASYPAEKIRIRERPTGQPAPEAQSAVPLRPGAQGPAWADGGPHLRHMRNMGMGRFTPRPMQHMMQAWQSGPVLEISLELADGSWVNAAVLTAPATPFWSLRFFLSMLVMTVAVIGLSVWAVRRATQPLAVFADAAERLGTDVNTAPVDETGPSEVKGLARAFNGMQRRLGAFVRDRTQMLAAISHDLRTPITRLRLRADFVEDQEQRQKMLDDLEQMEAMIAATLAFAREDATREPQRLFDLAVLIQDLCDDAADAGHAVIYEGAPAVTFRGRPIALKRVFANLIDNAVKYGDRAGVTLSAAEHHVTVTVEDSGPGLPEDQMEKVFAPFYRLEGSRSRDTGGVGLGLASVRSIVRAHGGEVTLANRREGGLRTTVELPSG